MFNLRIASGGWYTRWDGAQPPRFYNQPLTPRSFGTEGRARLLTWLIRAGVPVSDAVKVVSFR